VNSPTVTKNSVKREPVDQIKAEEYAKSWIEAWNAHDIQALGDHYAEDVVFRSPFIPKLVDNDTCIIHGRDELKKYLAKGMEAYPHMRFQLHRVGVGVDSIALNYIGVDGALANEVHVIDDSGKAIDVRIHYSAAL
jgi:hypothetical protein